jgi:hypothetical protein
MQANQVRDASQILHCICTNPSLHLHCVTNPSVHLHCVTNPSLHLHCRQAAVCSKQEHKQSSVQTLASIRRAKHTTDPQHIQLYNHTTDPQHKQLYNHTHTHTHTHTTVTQNDTVCMRAAATHLAAWALSWEAGCTS